MADRTRRSTLKMLTEEEALALAKRVARLLTDDEEQSGSRDERLPLEIFTKPSGLVSSSRLLFPAVGGYDAPSTRVIHRQR